jgi:hypothetical protein
MPTTNKPQNRPLDVVLTKREIVDFLCVLRKSWLTIPLM